MKQILVLGAGQSSPYLISYLLKNAEENDWFVTVGDIDLELAHKRVLDHHRGNVIKFDVNDETLRRTHIQKADVVINMLAPTFQFLIALDCIHYGKHMISASYQDKKIPTLCLDANRKGILVLNEMGLDPGIDHMSAMSLVDKIKERGGSISSFQSYGGGLPAPEVATNPLRYCITWNPRNIVQSGEEGAQYIEKGKIRILPHHQVFQRTWTVEIDGLGPFEAYPNRDSIIYRSIFGLKKVHTMIRGTLRYPGWSETWQQIVKLGLPNETLTIPFLKNRTYRELTEMFLPLNLSGTNLEQRLANFLNISPTGKIMDNLKWLGLFSDEKINSKSRTASEVMINLLKKRLQLPEGMRDMVIIYHEIEAHFPEENNRREKIISTFIDYGEPNGFTAIAKSVGLPAAIAAKLLLNNQLPLTGCHIPTHPTIYTIVLKELVNAGLKFTEKIVPINNKKNHSH
jgi:saccharopine dehydrogenase-like NADP-dependent oxidoreductase